MKPMIKVIYNFYMSKRLLDFEQRHWTYKRNIE